MTRRARQFLAALPRRRAHSSFRLLDLLPVAMIVVAGDGDIISYANRAAADSLGLEPGQGLSLVFGEPDGLDVPAWCRGVRAGDPASSRTLIMAVQAPGGSSRWLDLTGTRHRAAGTDWLVVTLVDQTSRRDLARTVERTTTDPLTGSASRSLLLERLDASRDAVVALFDLDRFKEINDRYGHAAGDRILIAYAQHLRAAFPDPATVARFGGDEFVVLLPGAEPDEVAQRCREVLVSLAEPIRVGEDRVSVTASVGLGSARGVPPELALARADAAMYAAKQGGRGSVQDYAEPTTVGRSRSQVADVVHALQEQTRTDPLTGLPNVRALREGMQQVQVQADRAGQPFSIVFLDIDHFGAYNRAHGDTAGDQALIAVGKQLTATCRAGDQVFRKGGEELVALLPATSIDEALAAAERLRSGIEDLGLPHDGAPAPGVLTVTAGVATSQTDEPAEAVLDRAGRATTTGKNTGRRNTVLTGS